ncbi:MAG: helix-turn-helix domain-containing protein [bacterium]|nr:helix-turn-helix domain-containing protein [bacterium]
MRASLNLNPFTTMMVTFDPERFYGWKHQIITILQVITASHPNGHAIYGIRAIGKTTLLRFLKDPKGAVTQYADYLQGNYHPGGGRSLLFVYMTFHHFDPTENIFTFMLEALNEELIEQRLNEGVVADSRGIRDDNNKMDVVNHLRDSVRVLDEQGIRVVFLLDDFDTPLVNKNIKQDDDRLLRSLCDDAAIIFVTEKPIVELRADMKPADSPLLGILKPEAIGLITDSEARQLVCEPAHAEGMDFSDEEITFLIEVGGRQPFLLATACELYFEMRTEYPMLSEQVNSPDTRDILQTQFLHRLGGQPHVENLLHRIWTRIEDAERRTLYAISQGIRPTYDQADIAARLEPKALVYLDVKNGQYCLFSRLFESFVQRRYSPATERPTAPAFSTREFPQLNIPPIDRALLRYFIQHQNKVLTFEELLGAVWEDPHKSKRALEAAVNRLRRTLRPTQQIKNIRGMGYKFVNDETPHPISHANGY